MIVRLFYNKTDPEKLDEFRKNYYNDFVPVAKKYKCALVHLCESTERKGEWISMTAFESMDDIKAMAAADDYKEVVARALKPFFAGEVRVELYEAIEWK